MVIKGHRAIGLEKYFLKKTDTIKTAMSRLSDVGKRQLFIVDKSRKLYGALSDGDIRRHILAAGKIGDLVDHICNKTPIYVDKNFDIEDVRKQMLEKRIEAMPVISSSGTIIEVLTWDEVFAGKVELHKSPLDVQVVIMAGGKGSRLEPFTKVLPKPLIPIGNKPVIEHIMDRFHEYSVKSFLVSLNYKAGIIKAYLLDMHKPFKISFFEEDVPLGTVGSLKLMAKELSDRFIVINCDVLMDIDYEALLQTHQEELNDLTLVICCRHYTIPYGVCEIDGRGQLKKIIEKPEQDLMINTGLYVMSHKVISLIPPGKKFDMPQLLEKVKKNRMRIGVFPVSDKAWQDVGQLEEYYRVIRDIQ